jgi:ubiquinone/menaquinone biosynthesis C-methylase UbiE
MDAKLQLRVQRYGWDAAAPYYEDGWASQLAKAHATLLDLADLREGQAVLEIACGSGMITRKIVSAVGGRGRVVATDLAQKMVDATEALALPNVRTARMNAEALEVADAEFDRAVCALGLMYAPDPAKALREMHRALRPGGRATATVWGERRRCRWADIFEIVDRQVRSEVCPMFFALGAKEALHLDFERAGFVDIEERRQFETLEFPNERSLLDAILLGGPIALAVSRFSDDQMHQVSEEFLGSVAEFRSAAGGYAIPGEFVTVAGNVA